MDYFFINIVISIWVFSGWYLAGLGPSFLLLPSDRKKDAFFLAPLIGMCLITLIGLFQLTVLLTPLHPYFNLSIIVLISVLICGWQRHHLYLTWKKAQIELSWFALIPTFLLLIFAWLFHNNGFHLLVGGSDQLQYSQNARQILEVMHTQSPYDIPVPRQDHFISDMITRTQPYFKAYRRGSELLLAMTSAVTHLTLEESFPVLILNGLITLSLALVFLGRIFLLSIRHILVLQAIFISSFYFLLLQIQGSLALIMSIPLGLIAITLLLYIAQSSFWGWIPLAAILVATDLSLYSEPAPFMIVLPSIFFILWQFCGSFSQGYAALKRMFFLFLITSMLAPFAMYSLIAHAIVNLLQTYKQSVIAHTVSSSTTKSLSITMPPSPIWAFSAVALGSMSYYDTSAINATVAQWVAHSPWMGWIGFLILSGFALLGYLKMKNPLCILFAIILVTWISICNVLSYQEDILRSSRALEYAIPFILLGLILLVYPASHLKNKRFWSMTTSIGKIIVASFIGINIYTCARTISFITSHNVNNDPILLRFNENWDAWHQLQNELAVSAAQHKPVLISGFKETIRPLAIAIIIRQQPHILGTSILTFWPIYASFANTAWPFDFGNYSSFFSKFSKKEFQIAQQKENQPWSFLEPKLIQQSIQAVVPSGGHFPEEWQSSKDIFAFKVRHFPDICDVIYRNEFDVSLPRYMVSSLAKDGNGLYRWLNTSGAILVNEKNLSPHILTINYDGKINDITLKIDSRIYKGKYLKPGKVQISVNISSLKKRETLFIAVTQKVKLRALEWKSLTS